MQGKCEHWKLKKKLTQGTLQVKGPHTIADFHICQIKEME